MAGSSASSAFGHAGTPREHSFLNSLDALFHIEMFAAISVPRLREVLQPIEIIISLAQAVPSAAKSRSTASRSPGLHSGRTSRRSG